MWGIKVYAARQCGFDRRYLLDLTHTQAAAQSLAALALYREVMGA